MPPDNSKTSGDRAKHKIGTGIIRSRSAPPICTTDLHHNRTYNRTRTGTRTRTEPEPQRTAARALNLHYLFFRATRHPAGAFAQRLFERGRNANLDQIAGSLTFTTLLSLVPMMTLALTLFAAFPAFNDFKAALEDYLADSFLPEETGAAILSHIADFTANAAGLTAAGLIVLALTAYFLLQTIDRAFSAIWQVRRSRSVARRVVLYSAAALFGPLMIGASLAATTYFITASMGLLPQAVWLDKFLLSAVPVLLTTLGLSLLYKIAPSCVVRWRHALGGAVFAAAGFEVMKHLFGLYLTTFPSYQVIYGAFAAFPIFLIWIYLSWLIALAGALLAAVQAPPAEDLLTRSML